jgi:hypothetical protein
MILFTSFLLSRSSDRKIKGLWGLKGGYGYHYLESLSRRETGLQGGSNVSVRVICQVEGSVVPFAFSYQQSETCRV